MLKAGNLQLKDFCSLYMYVYNNCEELKVVQNMKNKLLKFVNHQINFQQKWMHHINILKYQTFVAFCISEARHYTKP